MNSEQKKIKSNKKIRVFTIFLVLSLVFWLLIKLSGQYEATTKVAVTYTDIPTNKLLQTETTNQVDVRLKAIGFTLFKNKLGNKSVEVSLKSIKRKKGATYYYLTSSMLPMLRDEFSKSEVILINPDTLFFNLGRSKSKKLRVVPNLDIDYNVGYSLSGDLKIEPDFITVIGPESQIDTMLNVYTEKLVLKNVNSAIEKTLSIIKPNKLNDIRYSDERIKVSGDVEKFTERKLLVDFRVINLPKAYEITTYPKKVELVFKIGLSDFNSISANDFNVVCDYKESNDNDLNYLIPKLKKKSNLVKDVNIQPNKIEFLLEK